MLPADVARCEGVKSVRGVPLQCCITCARRIVPKDRVVWGKWTPVLIDRTWTCDGKLSHFGD